MCMDAATRTAFVGLQQQVAQLENLLKQHDDASELRTNGLCSMIAGLPEPAAAWTGTVRVPWFGLFTVTLRAVAHPMLTLEAHEPRARWTSRWSRREAR